MAVHQSVTHVTGTTLKYFAKALNAMTFGRSLGQLHGFQMESNLIFENLDDKPTNQPRITPKSNIYHYSKKQKGQNQICLRIMRKV